jgi:DNA-binding beta-propeller fold protein YncE
VVLIDRRRAYSLGSVICPQGQFTSAANHRTHATRTAALALLVLLMTVSLGVHSARAEFVYVGNEGNETISQFASQTGGLLAPLTPASIATEGNPAALASSPNGHNLYAITEAEGGSVAQFTIAADGILQALAPPSVPVARPTSIAVSPDGRFAYVTDFEGNGAVAQFAIGPGGTLAPLSPASVPVEGATAIAIAPDGRYAYVVDGEETGYVWQFEVASDGTLHPLSPASIQIGFKPYGLTISPDGRNVYIVDNNKDLKQLAVGADGTLSPLSPESVATSDYAVSIAVSSDGHSLISTDVSAVQQFERHSDGTLTPRTTIAAQAGSEPWGLAISPDGQSVYVTDLQSSGTNGLLQFGFDSAGELEAKTPMAVNTGARPASIAISSEPPPVQPPVQPPSTQSSTTTPVSTNTVAPPVAPTANAVATAGARTGRGETFAFDATLSIDPDGTIVSYLWTLDGHVVSTSPRFHRFFSGAHRSYRVTLTVRDDHGSSDSTTVTVSPSATRAPVVHLTIPATATFCLDCSEPSARMAAFLRGLRHYARGARLVSIASYADATGSRAYNLALTRKRSQAIARVLLFGLRPGPTRTALSWYGESDPVASNATAVGRARNRRSVIQIVR